MSEKSGWVTVSIPEPVAERIDAKLARDKTYRSRGEIVKNAVLAWLDESEKGAA